MKFIYVGFLFLLFPAYSFSGGSNMPEDPNDLFGGSIPPNEDPLSTMNTFGLGESKLSILIEKGKSGDKDAAYKVHQYYEFSEYDKSKADDWLIIAANLEHGTAQYTLALDFFEAEKYTEALSWCKKAIENGEVEAKELLEEITEQL